MKTQAMQARPYLSGALIGHNGHHPNDHSSGAVATAA